MAGSLLIRRTLTVLDFTTRADFAQDVLLWDIWFDVLLRLRRAVLSLRKYPGVSRIMAQARQHFWCHSLIKTST